MELSAKYVRMIWEKKSFTAAAKALFISQPALSATVRKLEDELGFKIFDRATSPVSLTLRGQIYLEHLNEIHERENILAQKLRAVNDMNYGSLTLGGRPSAAYYIYPVVCGEFYRRYPGIQITMDMNCSTQKKDWSKTLDFVLAFSCENTNAEAFPLLEERLVVAVRKGHPCVKNLAPYMLTYQEVCSGSIPQEKEVIDPSDLLEFPFIKTGSGSDSDKRLSQIMEKCKVAPYIVANSVTFEMRYRFMLEGIGAVFVSDLFVASFAQQTDDVCYFALQTPLSYRTLYLLRCQNHTKSEIMDRFLETAIECCKGNPFHHNGSRMLSARNSASQTER